MSQATEPPIRLYTVLSITNLKKMIKQIRKDPCYHAPNKDANVGIFYVTGKMDKNGKMQIPSFEFDLEKDVE